MGKPLNNFKLLRFDRKRLNSAMAVSLILVVALLCIQLRCIHLRADTPEKISYNIGLYVDEGYKTLAPRNLVLFGNNPAHPADQYDGWLRESPLTNWPYYFMFKWFGVEIENARLVTAAYFTIFIFLFCLAMAGRYSFSLLLIGIFALSLQHTFYFFSRAALLEVPIATLLYGSLFLFAKTKGDNILSKIKWIVVAVILSTFGIKKSSLIYFFIAGGVGFLSFITGFSPHENKKKICAAAGGFIVMVGTAALIYYDFWWPRVGHSVFFIITRALNNPLARADIFLLLTGVLCGLHGLIRQPRLYIGDFYRAALLGLVFLGPIVLSIFPYNPLRYYVPLVPAYLLLILEWLHLRTWGESFSQNENRLSIAVAIGMLFFSVFYFVVLINEYVLKYLPIMLGDEPGLSGPGMVRFFAPLAGIATVFIFIFRKHLFSHKFFVGLIAGVAVLGVVFNVVEIARFALNPSYQSREIQAEMETIVPDEAILAGDWAPFFSVGTGIYALYMNDRFNRTAVPVIRPDFFLDSGNQNSRGNAAVIVSINGASLAPPVLNAEYAGSRVTLYPVLYDQ